MGSLVERGQLYAVCEFVLLKVSAYFLLNLKFFALWTAGCHLWVGSQNSDGACLVHVIRQEKRG